MRIHHSSCGVAVQHIDGLPPRRWTHQMTPHPMQYRGSLQGASIIATCAGKAWNRQHTEERTAWMWRTRCETDRVEATCKVAMAGPAYLPSCSDVLSDVSDIRSDMINSYRPSSAVGTISAHIGLGGLKISMPGVFNMCQRRQRSTIHGKRGCMRRLQRRSTMQLQSPSSCATI